jgi:hypothetical protein
VTAEAHSQTIVQWPSAQVDEACITLHTQAIELDEAPPGLQQLTLTWLTPMRLQHQDVILRPEALKPADILMALVRRLTSVSELLLRAACAIDATALHTAATQITSDKSLIWCDWVRHSNRQRQQMKLGGVMGNWTLRGPLNIFWPYLQLGQWLHVGKATSFGLGQYVLSRLDIDESGFVTPNCRATASPSPLSDADSA